jgi:hypothetical protein
MRNYLIQLVLAGCCLCGNAQKLSIGIGASANNTFFHKHTSNYDRAHVSGAISPAMGISFPVNLALSPLWTLRSGLAAHLKRYRAVMGNFEEPFKNVSFSFESSFVSPEIPLIISFKTAKEKKYKFEYRAGIVNSWYIPGFISYGSSYEGTAEPPFLSMVVLPYKRGITYSPDLYLAVGLLNMINGARRHEFTLSYQYGFAATQQYRLFAVMSDNNGGQEYWPLFRPSLSSFMLSYTFYPRLFSWGIEEPRTGIEE